MSAHPKSIEGNELLIEVYVNIPKRILWEILWDAGARLCPVGEESIDTAMKEPEARGSIVEWIMGEAITRECWLPKSVLKRQEPETNGETEKTDEAPPLQVAANVEGPAPKKKTTRKAASGKAKKASSKKTSGKQERLGLPERMRVD